MALYELTKSTITALDQTTMLIDAPVATFRVGVDEAGEHYGEIVFGPDIYPGTSVVDPNSALSLLAAAAHELTHYHRWKDKTDLPADELEHIDEALTSLSAILRYDRHLGEADVRQLVADAIHRLQLFAAECATTNTARTEAIVREDAPAPERSIPSQR